MAQSQQLQDAMTVIRRPLVTEKATHASGEHNRFTFEVDRRATKLQIRAAVQELYHVRVVSVATMNRKGEFRRTKFGLTRLPLMKRAVVKIHPEDKIELF